MNGNPTFLDALVAALDQAAVFAADSEAKPAAILWPDKGSQWAALAGRVAADRPVLTLGDYDQAHWIGPAVWIRCVVDGSIPAPGPAGIPIVYLPGYERSQIRSLEEAPAKLRPLLELQYRGAIFAQLSNRDWTLAAFLQAAPARGGLGIDVGADEATKTALRAASEKLADWTLSDLRRKAPLRADFFNGLLVPNLDREVLEWLNDPVAFAAARTPEKWAVFCGAFRSRFGLDPHEAGEIAVAQLLGQRQTDAWGLVWQAYSDAPDRYPKVEKRLEAAKPKSAKQEKPAVMGLFDARDAWPQDNQEEESNLRRALSALAAVSADEARTRLIGLDAEHRDRRGWVWARLGRSPLAFAIEHLAVLARQTRKSLPAGSVAEIVAAYTDHGWTADDAVMRALATVESPADVAAVGAAIAAIYRDWLEVGAERLQDAAGSAGTGYEFRPVDEWPAGTVVIFTDGLRYDLGCRLADALRAAGMSVEIEARLTTLPTLTPSGKPGASPAFSSLFPGPEFGPAASTGGPSLTAEGLRKKIAEAGYQVLGPSEHGSPAARAWTELGDIDKLGHDETRLAPLIDSEIHKLELRIGALLAEGWTRVAVVTDHGWLYLPGGLPKAELAIGKVKDGLRKGRAARLAAGVDVDVPVVPWTWDPDVRIAVGPGIRVFSGNPVYEHGGISPQECITPVVIARGGSAAPGPIEVAISWAGLRARITVTGAPNGTTVDVRRKAGDPTTTVVGGSRPLGSDGSATLLVADDDLDGTGAFVVVLGADGAARTQLTVTIGESG